MSLLIFSDLGYNPSKNFKFYSLQGQNVKIFLIFTYNQGKIFLILLITWGGGHVYLVSIAPHLAQGPLKTFTEEPFSKMKSSMSHFLYKRKFHILFSRNSFIRNNSTANHGGKETYIFVFSNNFEDTEQNWKKKNR